MLRHAHIGHMITILQLSGLSRLSHSTERTYRLNHPTKALPFLRANLRAKDCIISPAMILGVSIPISSVVVSIQNPQNGKPVVSLR